MRCNYCQQPQLCQNDPYTSGQTGNNQGVISENTGQETGPLGVVVQALLALGVLGPGLEPKPGPNF